MYSKLCVYSNSVTGRNFGIEINGGRTIKAVIRDETFADEELGELWRIANKLESWSILFIRRIETYVFSLYFNSSFPNKLKQILVIISYKG